MRLASGATDGVLSVTLPFSVGELDTVHARVRGHRLEVHFRRAPKWRLDRVRRQRARRRR